MSQKKIDATCTLRADLEAADWLIRRDRGFSAAEQDQFLQWLSESPQNGEWLARHQETWENSNLLAQWRPENSAELNPDILARGRPIRRRTLPVVLALAASVAVLFQFWRPFTTPGSHSSEAAVLASERRVLEDGSVVELNHGAAIKMGYTPEERRVLLEQGEAYFTVAKNSQRPFIVQADHVKIRAVGTAFNVRLGEESVEVLVTEGRVEVDRDSFLSVNAPGESLHAGQRAVVPRARGGTHPKVEEIRAEEIAQLLSWQPKLFDFNSVPLCDVALAFNRCNRVKIVIDDPSIVVLPIVASFRSDNVEGFVRLLETSTDVRAERSGDIIRLRRAP